ncbi:hypothetical protein ACWDYK_21250 [Streptomyces anthocyanicus]|uniref:hypothetical protein n=1 Tax=Streptomyces anthocyanicus TaxID=68174 RepID=UPI002F91A73D|nr:hypothetical protein OHA15_39515 [Streptomyces anthocyanicus]
MTGYVMAATDAGGERFGECVVSSAPTLGEAAAFGDNHQTNYVSVRHGHDITLYGRDATGTWSVVLTDAPAAVVVVMRRQHDAACRPEPDWDGGPQVAFEYAPVEEDGYLLTAVDVDGESLAERVSETAPTPAEAAQLGNLHEAHYVIARRRDGDAVTLHGRDAAGSWSVIAADVDIDTAEEMCLWYDLTHHYQGPSPVGHHPLDDDLPASESGRMAPSKAISLVVEQIRTRGLDYPTQGLTADRFAGGWSVYAPVDIDDSDPMAFLDIPVGRSVFLISDAGRLKEISSAIPPRQAEAMFTAEEAYVRRAPAEEQSAADLWDQSTRLESEPEGSAGISSFTVDAPSEEAIAARASRLVGPIAQQLATLGPPGWERFTAVFSFTVSGEAARLRFWSGKRSTEARVPEQTAVLVRRQRHLAARMPAGPWWRLLISVSHSGGTGARMTTDYDYGDQPFPEEDLLGPEHYRNDLSAYPRILTPAWLSAYASQALEPGPVSRSTPHTADAPRRPARSARDRTVSPPTRQMPTEQPGMVDPASRNAPPASAPQGNPMPPAKPARPREVPVLDTTVGWTHLHADPQVITYGRKSILLHEVEWVAYTATQIAEKRFMFPTFYNNTWEFRVGRYPYYGGQKVSVLFSKGGRRAEQPEEWGFLVSLVRQYVEPRLLAELVRRVRQGETVTVGGSVKVNQTGIACAKPRFTLPWASLSAPQLHNGMVCIYQAGAAKPVLTVPLSHPNAALIPDLCATLAS